MGTVKVKNLAKSFGDVNVISDMNLNVPEGSFTVLVGPSGCGKSTLLRLIAGLEEVSAGSIEINGRDVTRVQSSKRGIAMVFQSYALYPHMSVRDNMSFGLRLAKEDKTTIARKVSEVAEILQMQDLLNRKPKELSGGRSSRDIANAGLAKPQAKGAIRRTETEGRDWTGNRARTGCLSV